VIKQQRYSQKAHIDLPPTAGPAGDGASLLSGLSHAVPFANELLSPRVVSRIPADRLWREKRRLAVAILGAGNGGLALAGYFGQQGHRVTLWNRSPARIAPIAMGGFVRLSLPGGTQVAAPVAKATSDLAAALADVQLVLIAIPASGHADLARACAPWLSDGQRVLLVPGRTGGALEFRRVLRAAGCRAHILLGETNTFPLAARHTGPAEAVIYGTKDEIQAAALPATQTANLVDSWRPLLPMLTAARSVLHTGLANVGAILHPVISLGNAERIRRGESFDFYTDGATAQVASVLAAADAERLSVARAYGVRVLSVSAWIACAYGHHGDTMLSAVAGNPAYLGIKAPTTLNHRYLLEDVPTGLIPLLELGRAAGLALPTLRGLVDLAKRTLGGKAWQRARTLEVLGLGGRDSSRIRALVAGDIEPARNSSRRVAAKRRFPNRLSLQSGCV
jgi:opine dehydrogenase